ncbi:MAG: ArsR/SmtB family transcription factor [Candidatus Bipolaricaulia bacterium]
MAVRKRGFHWRSAGGGLISVIVIRMTRPDTLFMMAHECIASVALTSPNPSREAEIFSALGHPVRLTLVKLLADGPRCACELEPQFDLNQSTISRHLTTLRRAGVIEGHKDGVKRTYAMRCCATSARARLVRWLTASRRSRGCC